MYLGIYAHKLKGMSKNLKINYLEQNIYKQNNMKS